MSMELWPDVAENQMSCAMVCGSLNLSKILSCPSGSCATLVGREIVCSSESEAMNGSGGDSPRLAGDVMDLDRRTAVLVSSD